LYRGAHVEKERIVSLYQWPQEWGFLVDFYSKVGHGMLVCTPAQLLSDLTLSALVFCVIIVC